MLNIILLGIASLLTDVSSEMVYPILPIFLVNTLGASPAVLGLIEGVAESLASLFKAFSGYWSDRIKKRKPFAILGYGASSLGKLVLYLSASWHGAFLGRTIDRFGKGLRTAPRDAIIADSSAGSQRGAAFGLHRAMDTLGAVIGIILAYFLVSNFKESLRGIFLLSIIPAALGILFLLFVKDKIKKPQDNAPRLRLNWQALDKKLKLFLAFSFVFTLGNSSNQFLLLRAKNSGAPVATVILLYLAYNLVYFISIYPASRLSDRIGRKKLLVAGYLLYGLVYLGFAVNNSPAAFWLLFSFYGLYMGFTEGVEKALVSDMAPAHLRATSIGLHAMLVGIGLLPASLFAGILWNVFGQAAPFYFGAFMGIVSSIALCFIL